MIKNFKSIIDAKIDFRTNKRMPGGFKESEMLFALRDRKNKTIKYNAVSVFFGGNAVGKSNIIEALGVFRHIILTGQLPYLPNKLINNPIFTHFEIELIIEGNIYNYSIKYGGMEIMEEKLLKNNNLIFSNEDFSEIITTEYNKDRLKEIFEVEACMPFSKLPPSLRKGSMQIKPFLNILKKNYRGLSEDIVIFTDFIEKKLSVYKENNFPVGMAIDELSDTDDNVDIQKAFVKITNILKKLDISVENMEFKRMELKRREVGTDEVNILFPFDSIRIDNNKEIIKLDNVIVYHKNMMDSLVQFTLREESAGTRILIGLIGVCLKILENGAILVIDEMEKSLHPKLLKEIIGMFKSKRYNKNNAQLIFTTHNTDILDDNTLRVEEINIVDKTFKNGTKIKRLSDEIRDNKKIRNAINFRKLYLSGAVGGNPHASL